MKSFIFILFTGLFLSARGEDITPSDNKSDETGSTKTDEREVDASDTEKAVYFNFSTGEKLELADGKADSNWHNSFITDTAKGYRFTI